jgi:Ca2+:H+ antiporter
MLDFIKQERIFVVPLAVAALATYYEHAIAEAGQGAALAAAVVLIGAIVMTSVRVAHHAEILAHRVGEPYGTMILTL